MGGGWARNREAIDKYVRGNQVAFWSLMGCQRTVQKDRVIIVFAISSFGCDVLKLCRAEMLNFGVIDATTSHLR